MIQKNLAPSVLHKVQDYISNDAEANKSITAFTENTYLIKSDTGMGGTSAVLDIKDKNIIIVSPLNGMIKGKALEGESHQMFIFGGSEDRWNEYVKRREAGECIVLNTSFDQIFDKLNNGDISKLIWDSNLFIDEFQVYSEADYRIKAKTFYHSLFTKAKKPFVLSTATPFYNGMDLPRPFREEIKVVRIEYEVPKKKVMNIQHLSQALGYVEKHIQLGNKVVIISNDVDVYQKIFKLYPNRHQSLVGDKLAYKVNALCPFTTEEQKMLKEGRINQEKDIFLLSTSYVIGFDIKFDAAIAILVDQSRDAERKYINDIVQSNGRIRKKVIEPTVFYRARKVDKQLDSQNFNVYIDDIDTQFLSDNYLSYNHANYKAINELRTFPIQNLISSLNEFGFEVNDMTEMQDKVLRDTIDIKKLTTNVSSQDKSISTIYIKYICDNIAGDNIHYSGVNTKMLLVYAYGYLNSVTDRTVLNNIDREYDRLLSKVKLFLDVNDRAMKKKDIMTAAKKFYSSSRKEKMFLIDKKKYLSLHEDTAFLYCKEIIETLATIKGVEDDTLLDDEDKAIVEIFNIISETFRKDLVKGISKEFNADLLKLIKDKDKARIAEIDTELKKMNLRSTIFKNTPKSIKTQIEDKDLKDLIETNKKIAAQMKGKLDSFYNTITNFNDFDLGLYQTFSLLDYSNKKQKENHKWMMLFLLSKSLSERSHAAGFKRTSVDNREFNIVTKTTRQLRSISPYCMLTADIKSEFATFVDNIVGSELKDDVYQNILTAKGWTIEEREKAKKHYNALLNNWSKATSELSSELKKIGYTKPQIDTLIPLIKEGKGSFYKRMTILEREAIREFKRANDIGKKSVRIHDALMFPLSTKKEYHLNFSNIKFELNTNCGKFYLEEEEIIGGYDEEEERIRKAENAELLESVRVKF
jgi:hypothetical protein